MMEPGIGRHLVTPPGVTKSLDSIVSFPDFTLQVIEQAAVTTVRVAGELDLAARQSVIDAFESVGSDTRLTCIDLTEVTFIDCAGLRALFTCKEYSERHAFDMTIAVTAGPVTRLLHLLGVGQLFRTQ